jgi:acetyl-CoA acetyltransferase
MSQFQGAYIVAAVRTPVGKAPRGVFRHIRPDDMLAHVIQGVLKSCPQLDPMRIGDVIIGCAMPEAEQGLNVARIGVLLSGLPNNVPGVTINRFCSSGLQAVAMPAKVNPSGGAIALGHPLGATGAIRTATISHGLKRTGGRYGMVTMCIGTGMGAAGLFEAC